MSATGRSPATRRPSARVARRRRALALALAGSVLLMAIGLVARPWVDHAVKEIALPLRHEDIIRQQARDKRLDPALIAAVIYVESRFRDRTSPAGATGLMQLLPDTARFIARRSGGTAFTVEDLATPQINIAYGSFYLRYLLDHYRGSETWALAAYNGGLANVDAWRRAALRRGETMTVSAIPYPETRAYVRSVLAAQRDYRSTYKRELGLD